MAYPKFQASGISVPNTVIEVPSDDQEYNTKSPYTSDTYSTRGIWDLGNLYEFAPYEAGYCFAAVINGPRFMEDKTLGATDYDIALQKAFIRVLEGEFRGLDGIEDITSDNIDITDNISTISYIGKANMQSNGTFSMRFTEKAGTLITKYISRFLRGIKDGRTQVKTYNGNIKNQGMARNAGPWNEVFNLLYIITDATCLRVEKAFLILNAQPTTAAYSELYNMERGNIEVKEISVPFNGFIQDGKMANHLANEYITALVNLSSTAAPGLINLNSQDYGYAISIDGNLHSIKNLSFEEV